MSEIAIDVEGTVAQRPERPSGGMDRRREALGEYEAEILAGRGDSRLRWERFLLLSRLGLLAEAREAIAELIAQGQRTARWLNALAVTEARLGDRERAEALLSRLAGLLVGQPLRQARIWSNMAMLHYGPGMREVVGAYAEMAVQSDPSILTGHWVARFAWPTAQAKTVEQCCSKGQTLHLYPYWYTDLDASVTRIPVLIRDVDSESRRLFCSFSPLGRPGDPRLLIENVHIGGVSEEGTSYGASFHVVSRDSETLELSLSNRSGRMEEIPLVRHS